ncbi:MAG TPA: 16S rRNA (adenine(1518)-N(6)/adenine(1519)-N(6))-dimethyltransferase RsmA [Haloplasmataceae bacterium]
MKKDIATLSRTLEIVKANGFNFKKSYGQNFLVDINILKKIVHIAEVTSNTCVIEIGPGIGGLTEQLAKVAKKVVSYEIDKSLLPILENALSDYPNVKIINEDILKADIKAMIKEEFNPNNDIYVVANLPYYITTPILMRLLEQRLPIKRFCILIQKEVAERLCGGPNTKEYNALTIAIKYYTVPKIAFNVPRNVFIPKPNVDSAVLILEVRKEALVEVYDEGFFFRVVKGSFVQRRKTIYNNLKQSLPEFDNNIILESLNKVMIDPSLRGESLTIEQFAELSNELYMQRMNSHVK